MMKTNNTLCITEWQRFGVDEIEQVCKKKAQQVFNELVEFAHQEGNHCFLKFKNSKTLVAQNYVGLIQTKSGFCLEILPKTFQATKDSEGFKLKNCICKESEKYEVCEAKKILLKMLQSLKDSPFKESHFSNLKVQKLHLLEIFILMFLGELEKLIKRGIKSDYIVQEENRKFLKGKLIFSQNLKINFAHQERFYTASDEFSPNIAPNRIIKNTLEFLSKQNLSIKTSSKLAQIRFVFTEIPLSQNIDKDLSRCANSRLFSVYDLILQWCRIFLKRQAFTPYQGNTKAFALLFDMNTLFESFVASGLRNSKIRKEVMGNFCDNEIRIKTQEKSIFLTSENGQDVFHIKPDIVGYENEKVIFIADTKWKVLNDNSRNYGISQDDIYQIFAYLTKYQCEQGFLIYPKFNDNNSNKTFIFKPDSQPTLTICYFPLQKEQT